MGQPRGFHPNARGWWHRDRYRKFADSVALEYLFTDNWSGDRLQARGRLPRAVRDCNIAVIGVGALGSVLSELLVRAGVKNIALIDEALLESGIVNRHVATLGDVGKFKVPVIALRLRQISPIVRVAEFREKLPSELIGPDPGADTKRIVYARYFYDGRGNMCEVRDALEQPQRFSYKRQLLVQQTNRNGRLSTSSTTAATRMHAVCAPGAMTASTSIS